MANSPVSSDDFDAALDSLESDTSSDASNDVDRPKTVETPVATPSTDEDDSDNSDNSDEGAPAGPPPISRARRASKSADAGRADFAALFAGDNSPLPPARDFDEKIVNLREQLKRAEAQIARVKDAWVIRDEEIAALQGGLEEEQQRATEARAERDELQRFLAEKKTEFEAYGAQVAEAFAEKESEQRKQKAELEALREKCSQVEDERSQSQAKLAALEEEAEGERERAFELSAELDMARDQSSQIEDRSSNQVDILNNELNKIRSESEANAKAALKMETAWKKARDAVEAGAEEAERLLSASRADLEAARAETTALATEGAEVAKATNRDIETRQEIIDRLNGILQARKQTLSERDEEIERLRDALADANERVAAIEENGGAAPSGDSSEISTRALNTLKTAENILSQVEEAREQVIETFGEDADTIGDAAAKLQRVLTVTKAILGGG